MRGTVALFINSALAFASAELWTAALHETGHGLVAQALGFSPRIYAFYENNPDGTPMQSLLILAAGPVTSLVIGVALLVWYRQGTPRYSFGRLLLFWFAWLGIMEFVNYVIVTPFLTAGDTAKIADILGAPPWARIAVSVVAIAVVFALGRLAATTMLAVSPSGMPLETAPDRRRFIMRAFFLPFLAGLVLTAVGGIGGALSAIALGLLGTLGNIDIVSSAIGAGARIDAPQRTSVDAPIRVEPLGVILYCVTIAGYVFILSRGLPV